MKTEKNNTEAFQGAQPIFDKQLVVDTVWRSKLGAKDKLVLLAIAHMADDRGVCCATQQLIATRCGYTEKTSAARALRKLAADGYLKNKQGDNGFDNHQPNSYMITMEGSRA